MAEALKSSVPSSPDCANFIRGTHPQWLRQRGVAPIAAIEVDALNRIDLDPEVSGIVRSWKR